MEPSITIETLITKVLDEISQKGFSSIQPFSIGKIEERMAEFAKINDIILGGDELYMSAKQLRHSLRASKEAKDLVVSKEELISFPARRFTMELYYDGECFIYTDGKSKFIVHPNYKMKISREIVKRVNFITASRRIDKMEFNGKRYIKIGESEGNQAARSNCSSSHRCHRSAHRGSTWSLLSRCKYTMFSHNFQTFPFFFHISLLISF